MEDTVDIVIPAEVAQEARRLAERYYPFVANAYDGGWAITFPDLPGAMADAENWTEVGPVAHEALVVFIETQLAMGKSVPAPSVDTDFLAATDDDYRRAADGYNISAMPRQFTTEQAAEMLGLTARRVAAIASRRRVGRQVGRGYLFTERDIVELTPAEPGQPPRHMEFPQEPDLWNNVRRGALINQLTMAKNWHRRITVWHRQSSAPLEGFVESIMTQRSQSENPIQYFVVFQLGGRYLHVPGDVRAVDFPSNLFDSTDPRSDRA
jgi:predicted RNase H-like HicB family nuclease